MVVCDDTDIEKSVCANLDPNHYDIHVTSFKGALSLARNQTIDLILLEAQGEKSRALLEEPPGQAEIVLITPSAMKTNQLQQSYPSNLDTYLVKEEITSFCHYLNGIGPLDEDYGDPNDDAETQSSSKAPHVLKRYSIVLFSVSISMFGTQMTDFALGVWLYETTESATLFAILGFCITGTKTFAGPIVGRWVDKYPHKRLILIGHLGGAIGTLCLAVLFYNDALPPFVLIAIATLCSLSNSILFATLDAATIHLVPTNKLTQAKGLSQGAFALVQILAPTLSGFAYAQFGMVPIFIFDGITFSLGLGALAFISLKRITVPGDDEPSTGLPFFPELKYLWQYLKGKTGLLALLSQGVILNFLFGVLTVLVAPLVLSFGDSQDLGMISSFGGIGMLIGSFILMKYGTAQNNLNWFLKSRYLILFVLTIFIFNIPLDLRFALLMCAAFGAYFCRAVSSGSYQAIWARKIHPNMQGRTLGFRMLVSGSAYPLGYLLGGPLADVLESSLLPKGFLATYVGYFWGVGPGRGIAVIMLLLFVFLLTAVIFTPREKLRGIEKHLVDYGSQETNPTNQG